MVRSATCIFMCNLQILWRLNTLLQTRELNNLLVEMRCPKALMLLQWRGKAGWCNRSDTFILTLLKDFWCALGIILLV